MSGLETVIGTHNFVAENEDEISFRIGEVIVVLEKDEGYQDGWWQGRNARGEIGLFPMNYTAAPPPTLHTLEDKIDSLETAVTQMYLPKEKNGGLPTPSVSMSFHRSSQLLSLPEQQQQQHTSSSSSTSSSNTATPASYQKKLSSKHVHQSVATSLQNPELQTCLPEDWSVEQVSSWLGLMGFSDMATTFQAQEITGDILLELDVESLKELNVTTFGKRFKIYNAIKVLADENATRKEVSAHDLSDNNSGNHSISPMSSSAQSQSTAFNSNKRHPRQSYPPYSDDEDLFSHSNVPSITEQPAPSMSLRPLIEPTDPRRMFSLDSARPLMANAPHSSNSIPTSRSATPLHRTLSTAQQYRQGDRLMDHMNFTPSVQPGVTQSSLNQHHHQQLSRSSTLPSKQSVAAQSMNLPSGGESRSRYNFVRNSFLSSSKPQSALPVASRTSVDGITHRLGKKKDNALPDMEGWLHKQGDKYKTWNKRWFVLRGSNLFYFKSPKETRMKGIINLRGYRIVTDETIYAGKFCLKAQHERERTFYFYTDTETSMKAWMKALIKATITRDFAAPVMSSSTIPTVSLDAARRMKPRPPSVFFGEDYDGERPLSPSTYDSRPFSLTYTNQPEPIMRTLLSDQSHRVPFRNDSNSSPMQSFGVTLKEPPVPPTQFPSTLSSNESMPLQHNSEYTSGIDHRHQQQLQHDPPLNSIFYNEEDEDLIDPHQRPLRLSQPIQTTTSSGSLQPNHSELSPTTNDDDLKNDIARSSSPHISADLPFESSVEAAIQHHDCIDEGESEDHANNDDGVETSNKNEDQQDQHQGKEHKDAEPVCWQWDSIDYVNWMQQNYLEEVKIGNVTELKSGELLLDLLESISGKQVRRPSAKSADGPLTSMQMLDNIVAAFKFMGREGVVVDGRYTVKDVFDGNETKIMEMLRTIKDYADQLHSPSEKMASGGTFGEDEQGKLKALDDQ